MRRRISLPMHAAALLLAAVFAYVVLGSKTKDEAKGKVILNVAPSDLEELVHDTGKKQVKVVPRQGGGFTFRVEEQIQKGAVVEKAPPAQKPATPVAAVDGGVPDAGTVKVPAATDGGAADAVTVRPRSEATDGGVPRASSGDAGNPPPVPAKPVPAQPVPVQPVPVQPAPAQPAPAGTLEVELKVTSYRASEELEKALERVLPLVAERELGPIAPDQMEKFGFAKSEQTLIIKAKRQTVQYTIGEQAYGGATTYVLEKDTSRVFLISSSLLRSLDVRPPRYLERRLVGFEAKNLDKIGIGTSSASRDLVQRGTDPKRQWVALDSPETVNDLFGNWVNNVFRMGAEEYLTDEALPKLTTVVRIQFEQAEKILDTLEVSETHLDDGKKDYYARSVHTGQWVKLRRSDTEGVLADLSTILER